MKRIKQLFLFLIPTLTVGLVYVSLSQQNFFTTDDANTDASSIKVEAPNKHLRTTTPFSFYALNERYYLPILVAYGSILLDAFLFNDQNTVTSFKNRPPPLEHA